MLRTATYPPDIRRTSVKLLAVPWPALRDRDVDIRLDADRNQRGTTAIGSRIVAVEARCCRFDGIR